MYLLCAADKYDLTAKTSLFDQWLEPLLLKLEAFRQAQGFPSQLPQLEQYLHVCRWPFRRLEYSFVLGALLDHIVPNSRYLDAGSGVTPLAHVFAGCGAKAEACDGDRNMIEQLIRFDPHRIYGTHVQYSARDLTKLAYPDAMFDAISCVSVLEHIPAPFDQAAVRELLRVLKPGGVLVITVDFKPASIKGSESRLAYYLRRAGNLARGGHVLEIGRGLTRKVQARRVTQQGGARLARSANQCFEVDHLQQDILPLLDGQELDSQLPFSKDLLSVTSAQAKQFWDIESGLFDTQGQRSVLPAAYILRKGRVAVPDLAGQQAL